MQHNILHWSDCLLLQVVVFLTQLYHWNQQPAKAIELLEEFLQHHEEHVHLTIVNMLAQLYMERGEYSNTLKLIAIAEAKLCQEEPLPMDLVIKRGGQQGWIRDVVCIINVSEGTES